MITQVNSYILLFLKPSHSLSGSKLSREVEKLINHPVHIDEEGTIPSSFIPFCSFAGQMKLFGETLSNFQVPVCRLFTEKIVNGQVCYEADINRHKKNVTNWDEALHGGLNIIIDTNHEYDIKNLFFETENFSTAAVKENFETYIQDGEGSFKILLNTISIQHGNVRK